MCNKIEEVPGFRYAGKLYDTPFAALAAGLGEIATDIQRNHAGTVLQGLLKHSDALVYLLPLYSQEIAAQEEAKKDPPAEKDPLSPYDLRASVIGRLQRWAQTDERKAKDFITSGGYENLIDLRDRATDADVLKMDDELDEKGVA